MSKIRQSKTTDNLIKQLDRFKSQKNHYVQKLNGQINKNNELLQESPTYNKHYQQKVIMKRVQSIQILEQRLQHKVENQKLQQIELDKIYSKTQKHRESIEKQLGQIAQRNAGRIGIIKNMEEKVLKKIQNDLQKNQVREKHLKAEYQKIIKEQKKVNNLRKQQKKQAFEEWQLLKGQKWKLELIAHQNQLKQKELITQRNPKPIKKDDKRKGFEMYIPTEKEYNRLKNPKNKNIKEVGNQYLQQAKILHRQAVNNRKRQKFMNLNLKVVNYNHQVMDRIMRNTSDLSKINRPPPLNPSKITLSEEENPFLTVEKVQQLPNEPYEMVDDKQTQLYLKKIKNSLKEIQRIQEDHIQAKSQQLLLPITIKNDLQR